MALNAVVLLIIQSQLVLLTASFYFKRFQSSTRAETALKQQAKGSNKKIEHELIIKIIKIKNNRRGLNKNKIAQTQV